MTVFSPSDFLKSLSEGNLPKELVLIGMVKPPDATQNVILFSAGTSCTSWTPIPLDMIDKIEYLSTVPCKDHEHPLVHLFLKQPPKDNPVAIVLASLLRSQSDAKPPPERLCCEVTAHCADGRFVTSRQYCGLGGSVRAREEAYRMCNHKVLDYMYWCF